MATDAPRSPLNILLVEDHPLIAEMTVEMLRQLGHQVAHAASVAAAAQALRRGGFDVLLCDFSLPDGTAYDLARRFDGGLPPAILLSAHDAESMPEEGAAGPDGAAHFKATLEKPVDPRHLDEILRRVAHS